MYIKAPQVRCFTCNTNSEDVRKRGDGQLTCDSCVDCFYGMTIHKGQNRGSYATRSQARAALMRELRLWRTSEYLDSLRKRKAAADRIMSNPSIVRPYRGYVVSAWAQDVAMNAMVGRYDVA